MGADGREAGAEAVAPRQRAAVGDPPKRSPSAARQSTAAVAPDKASKDGVPSSTAISSTTPPRGRPSSETLNLSGLRDARRSFSQITPRSGGRRTCRGSPRENPRLALARLSSCGARSDAVRRTPTRAFSAWRCGGSRGSCPCRCSRGRRLSIVCSRRPAFPERRRLTQPSSRTVMYRISQPARCAARTQGWTLLSWSACVSFRCVVCGVGAVASPRCVCRGDGVGALEDAVAMRLTSRRAGTPAATMESTTLSPSDRVPPRARATWTTSAVAEGPNTTSSLSQCNKSPQRAARLPIHPSTPASADAARRRSPQRPQLAGDGLDDGMMALRAAAPSIKRRRPAGPGTPRRRRTPPPVAAIF